MKLRLLLAIISVFCFTSAGRGQFLHADGKEIVKSNGESILLRGIGLGGWLVPEGYMLHVPGYGSPTSIRNMILDLIGPADTDEFYRRYRANYINEKDIKQIADWGFNSIRLPFHYALLSPADQPGVFIEEGFQVLDSLITWSKRHQMYVILDMHCAPGGQNPNNISDSDGEAKLWTVPSNQDRTVDIWKKIAERYVLEPWVAGYDLLNEPVLPAGFTNVDLRNLFRRIALAIREVDNNHLLFLEGNTFATDFKDLTPPLLYGANVAYSFHKYWSETSQATIQDYLNLRSNWNAPLWMGESGENSNPWFYETIKLLEDNNIGWAWWTNKKIETTTSPLSSPITPAYQRVLDFWNGSAARPSAPVARDALFEMAGNLAAEKCVLLPDVVSALLDREFNVRPKPYTAHAIPGTINCVAYDLGNVRVAYDDVDYKHVQYGVDQPWNSGRQLRNDGVDIEACNDPEGYDYNVGWIRNDEWLRYTVTVTQAGIYEVVVRTASPAGGGALQLWLDGAALTQSVPVPATNGWQNWTSVRIQNVSLPAGEHVLTLYFTKEGFNINRMQFILKSATGVGGSSRGGAMNEFMLRQNYPNPFNPETIIEYALPRETRVDLKVYNILGGEIKSLVNHRQGAGAYSITWNGEDNDGRLVDSGVYMYILRAGNWTQSRKMVFLQ